MKFLLPDIERIITPFLERRGIELVELKTIGVGKAKTLMVIVWAKGGIDIGTVAKVSRHIRDLLEEEDIMPDDYNLEVSSPGLKRPLETIEDFRRAEGESVEVVLDDGSAILGTVVSASGNKLVLDIKDDRREISMSRVVRGKIKIDF
ncbi:ribosome maturation factor RimP [bacterium]|nr:ribosome maturation factor RimP [bacterium]